MKDLWPQVWVLLICIFVSLMHNRQKSQITQLETRIEKLERAVYQQQSGLTPTQIEYAKTLAEVKGARP